MLGIAATRQPRLTARLKTPLGANDRREDYLRATLEHDENGGLIAVPFAKQDSSMLSRMAKADCLIIRAPHAPAQLAAETANSSQQPAAEVEGYCWVKYLRVKYLLYLK